LKDELFFRVIDLKVRTNSRFIVPTKMSREKKETPATKSKVGVDLKSGSFVWPNGSTYGF
jgi:hypothetical protein